MPPFFKQTFNNLDLSLPPDFDVCHLLPRSFFGKQSAAPKPSEEKPKEEKKAGKQIEGENDTGEPIGITAAKETSKKRKVELIEAAEPDLKEAKGMGISPFCLIIHP